MKRMAYKVALAMMRWVLRTYKRVKRIFVKPLPLQTMTVGEMIDSEAFRKELALQIALETKHHDEMAREAFARGLRLQRAPIARLRERELFDVDNIIDIYKRIVCKQLNCFSAAERDYIRRLCMAAYSRVINNNDD